VKDSFMHFNQQSTTINYHKFPSITWSRKWWSSSGWHH